MAAAKPVFWSTFRTLVTFKESKPWDIIISSKWRGHNRDTWKKTRHANLSFRFVANYHDTFKWMLTFQKTARESIDRLESILWEVMCSVHGSISSCYNYRGFYEVWERYLEWDEGNLQKRLILFKSWCYETWSIRMNYHITWCLWSLSFESRKWTDEETKS